VEVQHTCQDTGDEAHTTRTPTEISLFVRRSLGRREETVMCVLTRGEDTTSGSSLGTIGPRRVGLCGIILTAVGTGMVLPGYGGQ